MSRSRKRPYYADQNTDEKRLANRKVRSHFKMGEELSNGKAYRKVGNSWDIRDWSFHAPKDKKAYRK